MVFGGLINSRLEPFGSDISDTDEASEAVSAVDSRERLAIDRQRPIVD